MSPSLRLLENSRVGRWWATIDRWTLFCLLALMAVGALLVVTASPAVANRISDSGSADVFALARKQLVLLPVAVALMLAVSLLETATLRTLAIVGTLGCLLMLAATLVIGVEIKGARRWIQVAGFSLQASEFIKPCFAVTTAWLLARDKEVGGPFGTILAIGLWMAVVGLLLAQPDVGQTFVVTAIFGVQLFLAGLPIALVAIAAGGIVAGFASAYFLFPHVTQRIDAFLDPQAGDRYQITKALEAFLNGGWWGRGPGEGTVKRYLPDAHADFIFAVAGEELGLIFCILLVLLFAFIVLRGFGRLLQQPSLFALLAAGGLLTQFGVQALVNMASSLHLMPTKGMTLPFISFGGSSLLALAVALGAVLALTRREEGLRR